ncbi:hypothetical protein V8E53_005489 [Lactarius tabidus]
MPRFTACKVFHVIAFLGSRSQLCCGVRWPVADRPRILRPGIVPGVVSQVFASAHTARRTEAATYSSFSPEPTQSFPFGASSQRPQPITRQNCHVSATLPGANNPQQIIVRNDANVKDSPGHDQPTTARQSAVTDLMGNSGHTVLQLDGLRLSQAALPP